MPVRALLHYALEVPAPEIGEKFYRDFGLRAAPARDNAIPLRPAPLRRETVILYPGPRKRLHHLAFGAPGDDLEDVKRSLRRAGVPEVDPPRGGPEGGLWIRDPDGHAINIRDEATSVTHDVRRRHPRRAAGDRREFDELGPGGDYVGNYVDENVSILKVDGTTVTNTGKRPGLPGAPASMRGRAR